MAFISAFASLVLLPIFGSAVSVSQFQSDNLTALFAPVLSTGSSIYLPGDPDYSTEITPRYSGFDEPSYAIAIKPATAEDVQNILLELVVPDVVLSHANLNWTQVKTANYYNLTYLATGGGHAIEPGFATVQNAIDIDLGNFDTLELDAEKRCLTIGPALAFKDIFTPLYNAGLELQTGNAPCVNVIGATIGAGVGPMQGLHGLMIDALEAVTIVTAKGDIVTASSDENSDLFWAVRGAGANFGIIVSATYGAHPATNGGQVINGDFEFDPASNISLWKVLHSWDSEDEYPAEMGMTISAGYNATSGEPTLSANVAFYGTQQAAQPYLDKLIALDPIRWQNLSVPWDQLTTVAGFGHMAAGCNTPTYTNHYHVGVKATDVDTMASTYDELANYAASRPWYRPLFAFQRYNSKASVALPEAQRGVYPWRDIRTLVAFNNFYDGPEHDAEVAAFIEPIRQRFEAVSGFEEQHYYINYAFGDEGPAGWWSAANVPRLTALKRTWDPLHKFGAGNPIPL